MYDSGADGFERSSQHREVGGCDDRLNPSDTCRSNTPSASQRSASSLRSAASEIVTTMRWPRRSTAYTRPRSYTGGGRGATHHGSPATGGRQHYHGVVPGTQHDTMPRDADS